MELATFWGLSDYDICCSHVPLKMLELSTPATLPTLATAASVNHTRSLERETEGPLAELPQENAA